MAFIKNIDGLERNIDRIRIWKKDTNMVMQISQVLATLR